MSDNPTPQQASQQDRHIDRQQEMGAPPPDAEVGFNPLAGLLAFLLPGLGHIYKGEKSRGILVFVGIMGMILGGMFIGGAGVVDRYRPGGGLWWFRGQAMAGPVIFAADWFTQNRLKAHPILPVSTTPDGTPVYSVTEAELLPSAKRLLAPDEIPVAREVSMADGSTRTLIVAERDPTGEGPAAAQPLGREADIATLYVLCAGMLNLIAIIDCLFPVYRRSIDERTADESSAEATNAGGATA